MSNREVLIADNDAALMEALSPFLEEEQFGVRFTRSGKQTLVLAREAPALVLLSWELPDLRSDEVCQRLRQAPETKELPIIILAENAVEADRLTGLDSGADDFLVKPISPRELLARIRAVLRRSRGSGGSEVLVAGDIEMDLARHLVRRRGGRVTPAATEFRLLEAFMRNPGRVLTRDHLLGTVWAHDRDIHVRTVDVHIRRLRKALEVPGAPDPIRTVRSAGYSLDFGP